MSEISAAAVKALRDKTGLPMMECKKALQECNGDTEAAVKWLREQGNTKMSGRADRETGFGRVSAYGDFAKSGAIIELCCESAPVSTSEEFRQLADDLAKQLAAGPGAATADELLTQHSPSKKGMSLKDQLDDLSNRFREVLKIARIQRMAGVCAGYSHQAGVNTLGVLLQVEGGTPEAAKDVCMHIAALRPRVLTREQLDPQTVAQERDIQAEIARKEGKPEGVIQKMIEGRMRNFYAECVLLDQPFAKDSAIAVGKFAEGAKMKLVNFVLWELGK